MKRSLLAASLLALAGCASAPPSGPSVMVLPGSGKSFDQFRLDDYDCRQFASSQVGTTADQASSDAGARSAVLGAAVGGLAGAALGGNSNAAVAGAALGTAGGALAGTGSGAASGRTVQQRYDIGYQQCMYAKGNQIPMAAGRYNGHISSPAPRPSTVPPPPPPPGNPPPPKPG